MATRQQATTASDMDLLEIHTPPPPPLPPSLARMDDANIVEIAC